MTDPRIQVSTTADRVIAHDVLDDLTELDRHTESIGDGVTMRLDGPFPTVPGDRKCWWRVLIPQLRYSSAAVDGFSRWS
jgi:hypothetical protein